MSVLVGSRAYVSRPMSSGYKHPDIFRCAAGPDTTRAVSFQGRSAKGLKML